MFIHDNAVVDIAMNTEIEARLIECFIDAEYEIYIPCFSPDEKYLSFIKKLEKQLGKLEEHNFEWFDKKNPSFQCSSNIFETMYYRNREINWYRATINDLIDFIEYNKITYWCCIIKKGHDIKNYSYLLHMDEHYFVDGDEKQEFRSLIFEVRDKEHFYSKVFDSLNSIV